MTSTNLDLPSQEAAAIEVAFGQHTRTIDLIRLSVDDHPAEHFAVIAGIGVDAMIMEETDPDLKDKVGSAAYFVAAAKALQRLPMRMTVQLDGDVVGAGTTLTAEIQPAALTVHAPQLEPRTDRDLE